MAFPQVAAVNGGNDTFNQQNHTVPLPAGINAGDLLLVFFVTDYDAVIGFPGGWTQLFQTNAGNTVNFGAWYRVADGGEGASIVVTTSNDQMTASTSYRITDYSGTPECGTAVLGSNNTPDPPSLTPTWGARDTLWFAACGYDYNRTITAYPTNYTNGRNDYANVGDGCGVGTARRELNAISEDPGTFTLSAADEAVSNTVAVQPPISAGGGSGAGGVTGAGQRLLID